MLEELRWPLELVTREISRLAGLIEQEIKGESGFDDETHLDAALPPADSDTLFALAHELLCERQARSRHLTQLDLGEPEWDMALDLYISALGGKSISVSSACLASGVPATTALRHLANMGTNGLVERVKAEHDGRLIYVRLTSPTMASITTYLRKIRQARCQSREA